MLVLAAADLRALLKAADITAAMSRRGAARHRRGVRRRPAGAAPAPGAGRVRRQPAGCCWPAPPSSPATGAPRTPGSRTRTRCAARRRCTARPATPSRTRQSVAGIELASAIDNPVVTAGRPGGVQRQLPRRAGRVRARLPGDRRRRRRLDRRAAHRPDARRGPLARAAAVPGRRPGRRLRAHDRPVHAGRHRVRAQAARRPRERRLHPVVGHAGGPRVDGLVGGAQAAPRRRRAHQGAGHRAAHRRPGAGPARPARARAPRPAPSPPGCGPRGRTGRAADRFLGPGDRGRRRATSPPARRSAPPRRSRARSRDTTAPVRMLLASQPAPAASPHRASPQPAGVAGGRA